MTEIRLLKSIAALGLFGCMALATMSCSERMNPSDIRPEAAELLAKAHAAKSHPLTWEESRRLEDLILDEFLTGGPKEDAEDFRKALQGGYCGASSKDPGAPDTEEVRTKWALLEALDELCKARAAEAQAEYRAKNPPFDSTGKTKVQIVFVKELNDPNAAAMIYRRSDDRGRSFLLVREDSLNASDLYRLVRIVARRAVQAEPLATAEQWHSVHRSDIEGVHEGATPPAYQQIIDEFAGIGTKNLPGLGTVRTIYTWTRTPETGK